MNIIETCEQGSAEWLALRLGKVTASRFAVTMMKGKKKGEPSKTAHDYLLELVLERYSGKPTPFFTTDAMAYGTKMEPIAREEYESRTGAQVDQVAFIEHDEYIGVSPDGLVAGEGLIEIKCPQPKTQLRRYLAGEGIPKEYVAQVQGQLWASKRKWCDFLSYSAEVPEPAQFLLTRVYRDEEYIEKLSEAVTTFAEELKSTCDKLYFDEIFNLDF